MKKYLLPLIFCAVGLSVSLFGENYFSSSEEILQTLDGFIEMDCAFHERLSRSSQLAKQKEEHATIPHIPLKESTSTNWCGYAAATSLTKPKTGVVTFVSGAWTVPTISSTPDQSYCSAWVGIDGYSSSSVEQIGTEHDWDGTTQQNYAWFEMYPKSAYEIVGFPVNVGDVIVGAVSYVGKNTFQLLLINYTEQVFTIVPTSYTTSSTAKRSSAEWIVEAPSMNTVLPLAHFSPIPWTDCSTTIKGVTGSINDNHWAYDTLTMQAPGHPVKATPSGLSAGGTAFTVTWSHE